jgi:hypothetical protein
MREKINTLRHLGVLSLTLLIFFLGVFIGGNVEDQRVDSLYNKLQEQDLEYQNIVTESNYLEYLVISAEMNDSSVTCDQVKGSYFTSITNLDDSRIRLEEYINTASVNEEEYFRLKSHYENVQIQYFTLANRISSLCSDDLNTILFFYDEKKTCPECEDQGIILDYVKKVLKDDVLIFSLDIQKKGPIQLLAQTYDAYVSELPVIVINGKTYGFSSYEEIFTILCDQGLENDVCLSEE